MSETKMSEKAMVQAAMVEAGYSELDAKQMIEAAILAAHHPDLVAIPLDLSALTYTDQVPTEPAWIAVRCMETGEHAIIRFRPDIGMKLEGWSYGPTIARLAPSKPEMLFRAAANKRAELGFLS